MVGPVEEILDARNHSKVLCPDRDARTRPRPGGFLPACPYRGGIRRLDRQPAKIRLIFESLREAGIREADLDRVTAPVGLDIGSQTVPEIAISIVAELIARRNLGERRGSGARQRETPKMVDAGSGGAA